MRELVEKAKAIRPGSLYLFSKVGGEPYSSSGFQTNWKRLMDRAIKEGVITDKFTFHDIRAMTVTNAYEKLGLEAASNIAGHTQTGITKRVYVRNKDTVYLPE